VSDIALLKELINDASTVKLDKVNDKNRAILREHDYSVTIHGLPNEDEIIIIKADNFPEPKKVFKGNKGECKRADVVIIINTEQKKFIICIEMKAGNGENNEIIQQLKGARCFVTYCQKIVELFWNDTNFLKNYQYRFVNIKKITLTKKPEFIKKSKIHDSPEKMLTIISPSHLKLDELIQ